MPTPSHFNMDMLIPAKYVACKYDSNWYVRNIIERSEQKHDVIVNFMQRSKKNLLSWPCWTPPPLFKSKHDECWVLFQHVLCVVEAPELQGKSVPSYTKLAP